MSTVAKILAAMQWKGLSWVGKYSSLMGGCTCYKMTNRRNLKDIYIWIFKTLDAIAFHISSSSNGFAYNATGIFSIM